MNSLRRIPPLAIGESSNLYQCSMLPFILKVTHQSVERLCRITARSERQDIDVDVDIHEHSRELLPLFADRESTTLGSEVLNEAMERADEAFVGFLQRVAQPEIFPPLNRLNRYPHRLYCLLMSPSRTREALEIRNIRTGNRLIYSDYELVVSRKTQLEDTEAYLIAPNKYTLFMRQAVESSVINVYRSDFVDLVTDTPPPLNLHAQDVIDTLESSVSTAPEHIMEGQQLLMFSPEEVKKEKEQQMECPKCGGPVQTIGAGKHFCLDCTWDNLPPLN